MGLPPRLRRRRLAPRRCFAEAVARAGLKHKRTRPHTPRTTGKAERFIQGSSREWAHARPFHSSAEPAAAMPARICRYTTRRPTPPTRASRPSQG
jgi:hypothetical protein